MIGRHIYKSFDSFYIYSTKRANNLLWPLTYFVVYNHRVDNTASSLTLTILEQLWTWIFSIYFCTMNTKVQSLSWKSLIKLELMWKYVIFIAQSITVDNCQIVPSVGWYTHTVRRQIKALGNCSSSKGTCRWLQICQNIQVFQY